jgi:hypothetical protein
MGLLDSTPEEQREWARQKDLERAQEKIDAERALELQAKLDSIEAALVPLLKAELAAENEVTRISDRVRADFKRFKAHCDEQGFPSLPAPPQAIAEFLGGELKHGAAHATRLNNSIRAIHAAVLGDPNPSDDILVRAVLRCGRQDKDTPPQKPSGKGH